MSYSKNEIIDMAIGLERAGIKFYTETAEILKDTKIKNLFLKLADDEREHELNFLSLKSEDPTPEGVFTEEYFQYLESISGSKVFIDGKKIPGNKITSPEEALQNAFIDEKNAVVFYGEIKLMYNPNSEESDLLDKIIAEEREHIKAIVSMKQDL